MRLHEHLIELTDKSLIACRRCHAIGDVSITGCDVRLLCPKCHETLGVWATTDQVVDEITAFVTARSGQSQKAH